MHTCASVHTDCIDDTIRTHTPPSLAQLLRSFLGMVGKDATGAEYRKGLAAQGVKPLLLVRAANT